MRRARVATTLILSLALLAMTVPANLGFASTRGFTCSPGPGAGAEASPTASFPSSPTVRFTPRAIKARARGRWIQGKLVLPQGVSAADIDTSTVVISDIGSVATTLAPVRMRASLETSDAPSFLCMKFSRKALLPLLAKGNNVVTLSWAMMDGSPFSATTTVRVIGKKHHHHGKGSGNHAGGLSNSRGHRGGHAGKH